MVPEHVRHARFKETLVEPAVIVATWLTLVALGTGCFFAPRGGEAQPAIDDVVGFGCSTAIAGAAAAVTAFAIGGRKRWAIHLAAWGLCLGGVVAILLVYFLWFDTTYVRQRLDLWTFQSLQIGAAHWASQLSGYNGPLGTMVGIAFGAIAGLLFKFGRQWPRLATGAALAMMILFGSDFGRQSTVDAVTWLGHLLRFFLVPWSITSDQISVTAIIFAAVAGAAVAALTMYVTRSSEVALPASMRQAMRSQSAIVAEPEPAGKSAGHADSQQSER